MRSNPATVVPVARNLTPFAMAFIAFAALYAIISAPHVLTAEQTAITATALLAIALIALSAWDATTLRLPDIITLPLIVLGIATAPPDAMLCRALSAVAGGAALFALALTYKRIRHRDGLGLGDVKLFAAAGAWVGLENLSSVLLIACIAAIATIGVVTQLNRKIKLSDCIAFGPFLALGFWVVWLYKPMTLLAM